MELPIVGLLKLLFIFHHQNRLEEARPVLRKALESSELSPFWHCRLIFQLAVSNACIPIHFI